MKTQVFWEVTTCSWVSNYWGFRGASCLQFRGNKSQKNQPPWMLIPKVGADWLFKMSVTIYHWGITSQKTWIFKFALIHFFSSEILLSQPWSYPDICFDWHNHLIVCCGVRILFKCTVAFTFQLSWTFMRLAWLICKWRLPV